MAKEPELAEVLAEWKRELNGVFVTTRLLLARTISLMRQAARINTSSSACKTGFDDGGQMSP